MHIITGACIDMRINICTDMCVDMLDMDVGYGLGLVGRCRHRQRAELGLEVDDDRIDVYVSFTRHSGQLAPRRDEHRLLLGRAECGDSHRPPIDQRRLTPTWARRREQPSWGVFCAC